MSEWSGHRNQERHRTTGRRAWCECGEWCYERVDMACMCCLQAMANESPCPHCDGTGIAQSPRSGASAHQRT